MKLSAVHRPPWLRWQRIEFSPWLMTYIFLTGIPLFGPVLLALYRNRDENPGTRYVELTRLIDKQPSALSCAYAALITLFLIWFAYYSGNKKVTETDKFVVFLMLCGAAVGCVVVGIRYFGGI